MVFFGSDGWFSGALVSSRHDALTGTRFVLYPSTLLLFTIERQGRSFAGTVSLTTTATTTITMWALQSSTIRTTSSTSHLPTP